MTVISVTVATTKVLFDICNCTVDRDFSTGDSSLVLGILPMCGHAHMRSHVSPGHELVLCYCRVHTEPGKPGKPGK